MRTIGSWTLLFSLGASLVHAQSDARRPSSPRTPETTAPIQLGQARPATPNGNAPWNGAGEVVQASATADSHSDWPLLRVVRGQAPDIGGPPPPPPPPPPGGASIAGPNDPFDCGMVAEPPVKQGFFARACENSWNWVKGVPAACAGVFQGRSLFESDHKFDQFSSPVSNPFYMEDPRALTEISPLFIWQNTPGGNVGFGGGNNYFFGFRGSLAITPYVSLVLHKIGWTWIRPTVPPGVFAPAENFSEIHLGPKVTFIRSEQTQTVVAGGMAFEIPSGSNSVFQNTGTLTIRPYLSLAQNFFRTSYGSFNFINTTGYAFGTSSARTDFFFSSFHLDFNVGNFNRFYPMMELNWFVYTANGTARPAQNFDGADMFNFGAGAVAGLNELNLAFGGRFKFTEAIQAGIAAEFDVLGGARRLDNFRLTADVIFRY